MNSVSGKFKIINSVVCLAGILTLVMIAPAFMTGSTQNFSVSDDVALRIRLDDTLTSVDSEVGDPFSATVVDRGDYQNARVHGHVADIDPSGELTGHTSMMLRFDRLVMPDGRRAPIQAEIVELYHAPSGEKVICTASAHTTGGREGGASRTSDGRLGVKLSIPGTPGTGTNPEQLFAVGWSAYFLSAIKIVAAHKRVRLPAEAAVDAGIDLGTTGGGYFVQARLNVSLPGIAPEVAQQIVDGAHLECPYSKATHGNINVVTSVKTELATHAG